MEISSYSYHWNKKRKICSYLISFLLAFVLNLLAYFFTQTAPSLFLLLACASIWFTSVDECGCLFQLLSTAIVFLSVKCQPATHLVCMVWFGPSLSSSLPGWTGVIWNVKWQGIWSVCKGKWSRLLVVCKQHWLSWLLESRVSTLNPSIHPLCFYVCSQQGDIKQLSVNSDIRGLPFHRLTQSMIVSTFALCNKLPDLKTFPRCRSLAKRKQHYHYFEYCGCVCDNCNVCLLLVHTALYHFKL